MAAAQGGGGGSPPPDDDRDDRVYRAVAAGQSADDVRRVIDECAQGDALRRVRAVNQAGEDGETSMYAARRLGRGDLIGALLENGADAGEFRGTCCRATPLALAMAYGQVESVRALLRAGQDANERIYVHPLDCQHGPNGELLTVFCTAVHLCVVPPYMSPPDAAAADAAAVPGADPAAVAVAAAAAIDAQSDEDEWEAVWRPPQLEVLRVLVTEGGADVNARDHNGATPLNWLLHTAEDEQIEVLRTLLDLGADPNAEFSTGVGDEYVLRPIQECYDRVELQRLLLDYGASFDWGTLTGACATACKAPSDASWRELALELVHRSSPEMLRTVAPANKYGPACSLLDHMLVFGGAGGSREPWIRRLIGELLARGVPVSPENAALALPFAAAHAERRRAELAARPFEPLPWWEHEEMAGLAQDMGELREAEEGLETRRVEEAALEAELRELGAGGTTTSSGSEEGDDASESDISGSGEEGRRKMFRRKMRRARARRGGRARRAATTTTTGARARAAGATATATRATGGGRLRSRRRGREFPN